MKVRGFFFQTIDDRNIQTINIKHLRKNIGLVSQEPVLFDCSIKENICHGTHTEDIPFDAIVEVAKKANAHNFIMSLPQVWRYDNNTFYRGAIVLMKYVCNIKLRGR